MQPIKLDRGTKRGDRQGGAPRAFVPQYTLRKDEGFWIEAVGAEGVEAFEGLVDFIPEIVTSDADMASWYRRDLGKRAVLDLDALLTDEGDGPAQIELAPGLLTLGVELEDDRIDVDLLGDGVDHGSRQNLADL